MAGSMGRYVGDGLILASEEAIKRKCALIVVPSSGGARMQEGIFSLMQMPRSTIAINKIKKSKASLYCFTRKSNYWWCYGKLCYAW